MPKGRVLSVWACSGGLNGPGTDILGTDISKLSADDLDGRCWLDDWNVVKAAEIEQMLIAGDD